MIISGDIPNCERPAVACRREGGNRYLINRPGRNMLRGGGLEENNRPLGVS